MKQKHTNRMLYTAFRITNKMLHVKRSEKKEHGSHAQRTRSQVADSATTKSKDKNVFFFSPWAHSAEGAIRRAKHETRGAKIFFFIMTEGADTAMARARCAKRENVFLHSDSRSKHSEGAGTKREAGKFVLHSDRRRGHEARSGKFFFPRSDGGRGHGPAQRNLIACFSNIAISCFCRQRESLRIRCNIF